jgi:2-hydroxychromene-2-carboxylate isomerase
LPFRRPEPFPQNGLLAARVAHVGFEQDWGETFCRAVYVAEFAHRQQIGEESVIRGLLTGLSLAPDPILARAHSPEIKDRLRATTEEAQKLGIFGAPNFVVNGELFWGNDRLERALRYAQRVHPTT